jgi:hypothetical protein
VYLLVAVPVELGGSQDVRNGSKAMEQHGHELDDQDQSKEEHEHQTNGLQL